MSYKVDVLAANQSLKSFERTFNGAAKRLILADGIPSKYKTLLKVILADKDLYKVANQNVRVSKKGLHSPFFVLQFCYKIEKAATAQGLKLTKKEVTTTLKKVA